MNRVNSIIAVALSVASALILSGCASAKPAKVAGAITIASKGEAKAVIVVADGASAPQRHAAGELASFLGQVTGGKFEIVSKPVAGKSSIFVGPKAAAMGDPKFTTTGLGLDGLVIKTVGNNLILAGGEPRGTLYAVYTFLEDYVGCRWYSPSVSKIPRKPDLSFAKLDRRYVPPLEHREILIAPTTIDADWSVRNKLVGELHGYGRFQDMAERGGTRKAWPCGHSYFTVLPPETYFAQHPEWYSQIGGKRIGAPRAITSLCLSNNEMVEAFIARTKEEVARVPDLYPSGTEYVAVSAEDESVPCECDKCQAIDREEGSPSGLALRLANAVADAFKRDGINKQVRMFAYHHTLKPPLRTKPHPGVIIDFCPIHAATNSLPMSNPRFKTWQDDLNGWLKISPKVYIYDYPDNVSYEQVPHPNFRAQAQNIKEWAKAGARGYFGDGMTSGSGGTEMAELRAWYISKLIWDPSQDPSKLLADFTDGYYGPAGVDIRGYLKVMQDAAQVSADLMNLSNPPDAHFLSIDTLTAGWNHLKAAEAAVSADPALLQRVKVAQLPTLFVFLARWDLLKYNAHCRGIQWPLGDSREAVYQQFQETLKAGGISLSATSQNVLAKGGK